MKKHPFSEVKWAAQTFTIKENQHSEVNESQNGGMLVKESAT